MTTKKQVLSFSTICVMLITVFFSAYGQQSSMSKQDKSLSFSDFTYKSIGAATKPGTATVTNNQLTMVASGADIWGKHDGFHFGYKEVTGDFDMSIQIISLSKAHQYTKAGIMARVDLSDSSQHVYFQIFPDNSPRNKNNGGCEFQYRSEKGGNMKAIYPDPSSAGNQFDVSFPNTWIRLKRTGSIFESYVGNDNKTWRLYSTFTLPLSAKLLVGPAATSHNINEFTTAIFAAVQLNR